MKPSQYLAAAALVLAGAFGMWLIMPGQPSAAPKAVNMPAPVEPGPVRTAVAEPVQPETPAPPVEIERPAKPVRRSAPVVAARRATTARQVEPVPPAPPRPLRLKSPNRSPRHDR